MITKNIENLMTECVEYSESNELILNKEKVNEYINNNDLLDNEILIVEKIINLLNNNRQLVDLEISELIKKVNNLSLSNVKFIDSQPMDVVSEIVNICDCSIVTFANIPILQTNSPNKLFDSLSAGKPIIVNSAGWTKDLVEKNKCGSFVDPTKPQELAELVIKWKKEPQLIKEFGANARKLAETVYDKSILSKQFVEIIKANVQ